MKCGGCKYGFYEKVYDYVSIIRRKCKDIIYDPPIEFDIKLNHYICKKCGDILYPAGEGRKIDAEMKRQLDERAKNESI